MNIKRFIKKNIYLTLFLVILLLFSIAYFKSTEGFQSTIPCNFNYCSGDYEVVNDNSGNPIGCLKKCNIINSNSIPATSKKEYCNIMENNKYKSTFSRNFNQYKKKNAQNNNACEYICPAQYTYNNGSCIASPLTMDYIFTTCKDKNGLRMTSDNTKCQYCPPTSHTGMGTTNERYSRPTPSNNSCNAANSNNSYK